MSGAPNAVFFYALKTIFIVHNGQGWDAAGAKENQDNKKYLNWALALIRDLFFPGKKPKEIIEQGGDDSIKDDLDSGGKKDEGDVKVILSVFS